MIEGTAAELHTTEMHTGGEPVRIVTSGYPPIPGDTILAKRRFVKENLDHLRRFLMFEPRGHADMYGVIPVEPDDPDADLAVLFMHNEGYSTMCGHATIALGRWAVDTGIVAAVEPETRLTIQCPCGPVTTYVSVSRGRSSRVRFESVPAFAHTQDASVSVPGLGAVAVDVGYGGAFYAVVDAASFGLDVRTSPTRDLVDAADAVTGAAAAQIPIHHDADPDLAFLYGTILTDGRLGTPGEPSANVCVFADRQVDRSPTGSGVTARIALQMARDEAGIGDLREFESVTGAVFTGRAVRHDEGGVVIEVGGEAHYTGTARFTLEPSDPLPSFLLR